MKKNVLGFGFLFILITGCGGGGGSSSSVSSSTQVISNTTGAHNTSITAVSTGSYTVASTNIELDNTNVGAGRTLGDYMQGYLSGSTQYYVNTVLTNPADTFKFTFTVPSDASLYGSEAGVTHTAVGYILYPTTAGNVRADYSNLGSVVPKMQLTGQAPLLENSSTLYPLIIYSHGQGAQPVNDQDIASASLLASHGYIVCVLFHGDNRFPNPSGSNNYSDPVWNQWQQFALRPLMVSRAIDEITTNATWGFSSNIDTSKIGMYGQSFGGATAFALAGAQIIAPNTHGGLYPEIRGNFKDTRIKASAGIVPFMSSQFFGYASEGASTVTTPYMAITGTADQYTSVSAYETVLGNVTSTLYYIKLTGATHSLTTTDMTDANTWLLYFFDAYIKGDSTALTTLQSTQSVTGGTTDTIY